MSIESSAGKMAILTLGCRVNQYESQAIREKLAAAGFQDAPFEDLCELYIINTCAVTGESARKSRQMIRRALKNKEKNPQSLVCVTGCYVQGQFQKIESDPLLAEVDLIVGNAEKGQLSQALLSLLQTPPEKRERIIMLSDISKSRTYSPLSISRNKNTRAFLKIQDGCNSFCSYCFVPFVRGRVVSRPYEEVRREAETLVENGYREIVLTGIETGAYGEGLNEDLSLATLVEKIASIPDLQRIRFGSLKPSVFTEEFCARLAAVPQVMPHFHLSLQSGSSRVLAAMNRRYDRQEEVWAIERIYRYFPDAGLSADFICGFPGESEADFQATAALIREAALLHAHIFPFSPREKTRAAAMPEQIPEEIKKERCKRLLEIAKSSSLAFAEKRAGKRYRILGEKVSGGCLYGYTENFMYTKTPVTKSCPSGRFYEIELEAQAEFSVESMVVSGKFLQEC